MNKALKWKLAFAFLLVFIAGVMTGLFGGLHMRHLFLGPPHSGEVPMKMREHLRRELDLTSEQEAKLAPIIESTSAKLEAIRVETAQRVRQAMEESEQQVLPELTSEQKTKLKKLKEQHHKILMRHGFTPPRPPDAPPPSP
jgi:hypothetical protein